MDKKSQETVQILTWLLGDKTFGLSVENCKEIRFGVKITPIPFGIPEMVGIANLRGEVITILNLQILLKAENIQYQNPAILRLKSAKNNIGLLLDGVSDLIMIDTSAIKPVPSNITEAEQRYLQAVVSTERGLIWLINNEEIVNQRTT